LRRLDGDLLDRRVLELGQKGIAVRPAFDQCAIAEANVQGGLAGDAFERAIDHLDAIFAGLVGT
jgi:hypothetical protein